MHRARERLVRLAKQHGVRLRQSYERVGKHALIAHQRYAHAKQFKRANRALKTLRTYLGRVVRDIGRKIRGEVDLESVLQDGSPAAFKPFYLFFRRQAFAFGDIPGNGFQPFEDPLGVARRDDPALGQHFCAGGGWPAEFSCAGAATAA